MTKIKGWERITEQKDLIYWRKISRPYVEVRIIYPHEPIKSLRKTYHEKWWVEISKYEIMKPFDSRGKAKKFAVDWMKKHTVICPICGGVDIEKQVHMGYGGKKWFCLTCGHRF